jgi:hypothetical protein
LINTNEGSRYAPVACCAHGVLVQRAWFPMRTYRWATSQFHRPRRGTLSGTEQFYRVCRTPISLSSPSAAIESGRHRLQLVYRFVQALVREMQSMWIHWAYCSPMYHMLSGIMSQTKEKKTIFCNC